MCQQAEKRQSESFDSPLPSMSPKRYLCEQSARCPLKTLRWDLTKVLALVSLRAGL